MPTWVLTVCAISFTSVVLFVAVKKDKLSEMLAGAFYWLHKVWH